VSGKFIIRHYSSGAIKLMNILAIDTATSSCSVAIWSDGNIISSHNEGVSRSQAEVLVPTIQQVLKKAKIKAYNLDLLVTTIGPGAFTGIRIGLATARAIAQVVRVPCLGLTTTEVIAHAVPKTAWQEGTLLVALDSKRADIYVQAFANGHKPISEVSAIYPADLGKWLQGVPSPIYVVGDKRAQAVEVLTKAGYKTIVIEKLEVPDGSVMTEIASERWTKGDILKTPLPLYLRPPDAKLPRAGGRLRP